MDDTQMIMSAPLTKLLEQFKASELLKFLESLKAANLINELGDSIYFELKEVLKKGAGCE